MSKTNNLPNTQRLQRYLEMLLSVYSPSKKEGAAANVIKNVLDDLGVSYFEDDTAALSGSDTGNIIAGGVGNARVSFCAHMDTIHIYRKNEYIIDNGIVRGKNGGVIGVDDKCGIAVLLEAMALMQELGGIPDDVRFLFTTSEEEEFSGARNIDKRHFFGAYNFVVDSGGCPIGRIVNIGASQYDFKICITGKMSHTGNPDGPHALLLSAELLCLMKTGRVSDETYINISDIHCEGNDNTIPERTVVRGQILSFDDDEAKALLREMDDTVRVFFAQHDITGGLIHECSAPGFRSSQDIIEHAKKAAEAAGLPFELGKTGAGSDAHVFVKRGAKAAKVSCGMMDVHSNDEYCSIADIHKCAQYVLALARDYSD